VARAQAAAATPLAELLPLGRAVHATAVRRQDQAVAERLEDELGPEQPSFIDSCQRDRAALPRPDLPLLVRLDGGDQKTDCQGTADALEPRGAHLQLRTRVLNDSLADDFHRWHPGFAHVPTDRRRP
jgi:hypothetical protein